MHSHNGENFYIASIGGVFGILQNQMSLLQIPTIHIDPIIQAGLSGAAGAAGALVVKALWVLVKRKFQRNHKSK